MHGHTHGGMPCHGHGGMGGHGHGHGHGHGPMAGARNGAPLVEGTPMTRQQLARIVCPVAIAAIIFCGYVVFSLVYGCTPQTATLPNDGIWFLVVWSVLLVFFVRGAMTSPGEVSDEWLNQATELRSLIQSKQTDSMRQQQEFMKRFSAGDKLATDDSATDQKGDIESGATAAATGVVAGSHPLADEGFAVSSESQQMMRRAIRPERAHFCQELDANVLRMDHYCLWFNNAVGLRNYKFFLLTLFYLLLGCLSVIGIVLYRMFAPYEGLSDWLRHASASFLVFRGICIFIAFILCMAFTLFSVMHLKTHFVQIKHGLTSIEFVHYRRQQAMANHFGVDWHGLHQWDHGKFENFKKFLGEDWYLWLVPTAPEITDDGYKYQKNSEGFRQERQVLEEIQQKRMALWSQSKFVAMQQMAARRQQVQQP